MLIKFNSEYLQETLHISKIRLCFSFISWFNNYGSYSQNPTDKELEHEREILTIFTELFSDLQAWTEVTRSKIMNLFIGQRINREKIVK